jgi:TolB-like protein
VKLFTELKRRNVIRVAIAYLVITWVLLQVGDVLFDTLELPSSWGKGLLALLVLGFVPAIIFSWVYELTPQGLKKESELGAGESRAQDTGKRLDLIVIGLLVVALGFFAADRFLGLGTGDKSAPAASEPNDRAEVQDSRTPLDQGQEPSVAVLAFDNMSPDPENAFFAEGISEEILNVLAQIDGLMVASRTSAFSFAGSDTSIPEIARQLNVAHVLEGSVRRQGNQVRITAQLIDAATDKHLWSDTFNRELDDIFAVQEEIGTAIATALQGTLGVQTVLVNAPTSNMEAYELFLRGRQLFYKRGQALDQGLLDLRSAVEHDPEFALAWAYLGATAIVSIGYGNFDDQETQARVAEGREASGQALAIDSDQPLAVAVQAMLLPPEESAKRLDLIDRAVAMAPDDAGLAMWAGDWRFMRGGYLDEALPLLERAYRLDPLVGINNGTLGIAYLASGQRELGRSHILRAAELGWPYGLVTLRVDYNFTGEHQKALEILRAGMPPSEPDWSDLQQDSYSLVRLAYEKSIDAERFAAMEVELEAKHGQQYLAFDYMVLGDMDRMFDEWEAAIAAGFDDLYGFRVVYLPSGRPVVEHPRFLDIGRQLGLMPLWESKGYPMGCELLLEAGGDHLSCPGWPQ